jgi:hypothetical protein
MKTRNPLLPLIAMTLFLSSLVVSAEEVDVVTGASSSRFSDSMKHPHGESGDMMMHWGDKLGLSGQQRTDIQIILADYMPRYRDLAKIGRETASGLMRIPPDDPGYVVETQKASATAASSAAELVTLLSEMRGKLYAVLNGEQRQKLQELMESRPHPAHEENPDP